MDTVGIRVTPFHRSAFDTEGFLAYIEAQGGDVLRPTNPWELARYTLNNMLHIVYTKVNHRLTWTGASRDHYAAFTKGQPLLAAPKDKLRPKQRASRRRRLMERDGDVCWYCGRFLYDDVTIEHLIPQARGGSHAVENLVLAHERCNHDAGDLSLAEKIALRESTRAALSTTPPWEIEHYV